MLSKCFIYSGYFLRVVSSFFSHFFSFRSFSLAFLSLSFFLLLQYDTLDFCCVLLAIHIIQSSRSDAVRCTIVRIVSFASDTFHVTTLTIRCMYCTQKITSQYGKLVHCGYHHPYINFNLFSDNVSDIDI